MSARAATIIARVSAALALLGHGAIATAQERLAVDELVRQGVAARQLGHDEEALALFSEAHRRAPSPSVLAQMGAAEQALGRWLLAERHLRDALAAREHPYIQRNYALIAQAHAVVSRHVGVLVVTSNVTGATVRLDGEPVGALPFSEPLRALVGTHTLEVSADGYYPASRPIDVSAETPAREEVSLRAREARDESALRPRASAFSTAQSDSSAQLALALEVPMVRHVRGPRALSWVLWGGGLAFVTGGAVAHGLREGAALRYNLQCVGPRDASDPCVELREAGLVETLLAVTGYVVGAGLATVGTIDAARLRVQAPVVALHLPRGFTVSLRTQF